MKTIIVKGLLFFLISIYFLSCDKATPEVLNISIKTPPTKVEYFVGEVLNLSGLEINLTWNDGLTELIPYNKFIGMGINCEPYNASILSNESTSILITHIKSNKNVFLNISVKELITDVDGNSYSFVKIGNQLWMAENLRVTKFNDGSKIPNITDNAEWKEMTSAAYCWYDNDDTYGSTNGALYNKYAAENDKLCPVGWHVPGEEDWDELSIYFYITGEKTGTVLKSETGWYEDGNGTDKYGFNGIPCGYRDTSMITSFSGKWLIVSWWNKSDTFFDVTTLRYESEELTMNPGVKNSGLSIRCVRD